MNGTKITKRQHEANVARITALKVQLCDVRDNMISAMNEGLGSLEMADAVNNLHDAIRQMDTVLDEENDTYSRRNWTSADYNSYELVAANID